MSYTAKQIDDHLADYGSISTLKMIEPGEINDPELSFQWGKARDALRAFERQEDLIVHILERRGDEGWK